MILRYNFEDLAGGTVFSYYVFLITHLYLTKIFSLLFCLILFFKIKQEFHLTPSICLPTFFINVLQGRRKIFYRQRAECKCRPMANEENFSHPTG